MASKEEHIKKFSHNAAFIDRGIDNAAGEKFDDWKTTAKFYAVVHLTEAVLADKHSQHSISHANRETLMSDHPETFPHKFRTEYITLKGLASKARYEVNELSPSDVNKAASCYEHLTTVFRDYFDPHHAKN